MKRRLTSRADRLTDLELAALYELDDQQVLAAFAEPGTAVATLTADLRRLWDRHRSDSPDERRVGRLHLRSGAYLQWIGYRDHLVVECSSNTYLPRSVRLTDDEQAVVVRAGFSPPFEDEPNFWLTVEDRTACAAAAFSVVAVLTAVFGVYAG